MNWHVYTVKRLVNGKELKMNNLELEQWLIDHGWSEIDIIVFNYDGTIKDKEQE